MVCYGTCHDIDVLQTDVLYAMCIIFLSLVCPLYFQLKCAILPSHVFVKHAQQYVWLKDEEQHERCPYCPSV